MYSREFIEQVRNANRIEEIVTEYLGKAKGGRWFCPWHEDIKHPNLCANKNKQIVRCFACMGHALDVFSFVMKMKGVSFIEAVKILANRVGIQLPEVTPEEKEAYERKLRNQRILKDAMEYYHKQYCDSAEDSPAKKHIANRKLEPGIVKKYGIGFALTEGLKEYLLSKGYSLNDCLELGLLYHRNNTIEDFFRNSLIFPITSKGIVASLVARQLTENANPKYLNLKGEIKHLFNEDILLDSEEVIITEGIIDALTLIQHGYSAIALSGVSLKDESLHRFSGVNSKFACLDPDEAGKKGIKKLGEMFNDDVKIISLPNGMDVDDYFIKYKKTDFERLKQAAKYYIEYEIEKEPAREIHIQDIDYACYCHKKVQAQISIAGVGANFLVPSRIRYRWISKGKNKQVGSGIMNIPSDDPIFVKMCNKSEEYQKKTLDAYSARIYQSFCF